MEKLNAFGKTLLAWVPTALLNQHMREPVPANYIYNDND